MRCFGRSGLALGPRTEEALQTYLSPDQHLEARKALGRNIEWDDRVPLPRARRFLDDFEASLPGSRG